MKKLLILLVICIIAFILVQKTGFKNPSLTGTPAKIVDQKVVYEESTIVTAVKNALPSVVTVSESQTTTTPDTVQFDPSNPFNPFQTVPGQKQNVTQNIGSGFIISSDGLVITNKHVVADTNASYKILTNDKKTYLVQKIYRDPLNDLAILKINATGLKPLPLGDSNKIQLGQMAIAIGTPLGDFTNTVTQGIISGLGRGINAGSPYEGYVEKLDNVIQTDAAINPGNSGGPLLNSAGQAIGINTAIAQGGQNIGFAIPINVVKTLIDTFNKNGGSFEKPYIGVRYKMIDQQTALVNNVAEGAYVVQVLPGSPAEKAGIQTNDIIIEFDGQKVTGSDEQQLTKLILNKKPGQVVSLKVWRNKQVKTLTLTLGSAQ